ncbi:MAG: IS66 family insertion sequence element accessory protein TnpB [Sphingomonadales bacterium]|nr:IS66 family insertion sequence element accessory protein TnpB [Sphingomonadales bacterium]
MIPVPASYRVCLPTGTAGMRRGMPGLQVQQALGRDPHAGDLYVFRGRRGDFIKVLWHDGLGLSLYAKRLERGRFIWPSPADGVVSISAAQLGCLLEGIDWRHPQRTWRPSAAG